MDETQIVSKVFDSLISSGPIAILLFYFLWDTRKDLKETRADLNSVLKDGGKAAVDNASKMTEAMMAMAQSNNKQGDDMKSAGQVQADAMREVGSELRGVKERLSSVEGKISK